MLSNSFTSEEPQDDEDIKCPKCLSFFSSITKPYILPCNHNICLNCIDSLITENNTFCPLCNSKFNKNDRNSFEVNFGFLNLVIKILQTKIIFCTKCNKIYYWKDHYQSCEQKYFENGNNILEDLRTTCEEGEKIAKLINDNRGELLNKYKKQIGNLVKNIISEIHKNYEDDIENKINNELFKTNISINFSKSKSEILNFMKLCLPYPEYFNTHEISLLLDYMKSYETNIRKESRKNRAVNNKSAFSPPSIKQYYLTEENLNDNEDDYNLNRNKNYETIGNYHMKKNINNYSFSGNYKSNRHISNINFNEQDGKDIISEEENDDDDILLADNCDDEGINESDRIKVKIYHDNNISKFKKIDNGNGNGKEMANVFNKKNIYQNKNKSDILKKNIIFNSQRPLKKTVCKITQEKKKNKFDINALLDNDINIEEESTKKKIIVGLKDVKVISLKKSIGSGKNSIDKKKGRVNSKLVKPNLIIPGEKGDLDNAHSFISTKNYRSNRIIFNKENYDNYYSNNNKSQTIQIEAPSLNLLRSSDYLKRDYRFHGNINSKKNNINNIINNYNKIRTNNIDEFNTNFSNTINVDHSFEQILTRRKIINDSKNMNYSSFKTIGRESDIFSMNKIIKNFNKIKDITNKVKNYEDLINYLSNNIKKEVKNNMILLKNVIINNYQSLLSEISYNSNRIQKNYLLTQINDTYNILIYDSFNRKYQIKNYNLIFKNNKININAFNNSTSIVYDDNDLIFISGGDFIYDLFIILSWSTGKIIHNGKMPTQKAYHKTIFFNEKLYLIGGETPNKKTSPECFFFDLKEKKWHNLPNLKNSRKNASVCFYNNSLLYVFRGEDDNNVLDTIEYIDVNDKKGWNLIKPIDNGYVWFPAKNSMVLTIDKDKIIICGGEDNEGNLYKDCFLFEPSKNCIYKGLDLVTSAAFIAEGCIYQDEIFSIDYKNKTQNQKAIIHTSNTKKNIWKFSYIK